MYVVSCEQKLKTMLEYVYRTALFNYLKIIHCERKLKSFRNVHIVPPSFITLDFLVSLS